jgi:hypothetical protein
MNLTDLRVKTKLMLAFAFLAAIVLAVSAPSLHSLGASKEIRTLIGASVDEVEADAHLVGEAGTTFRTAEQRAVAFG